jgi:hypothetical protein
MQLLTLIVACFGCRVCVCGGGVCVCGGGGGGRAGRRRAGGGRSFALARLLSWPAAEGGRPTAMPHMPTLTHVRA